MSTVITSFVNPPIPVRRFDWIAYMDGDEEDGPYGRGETELEAVKDLAEELRAELKRASRRAEDARQELNAHALNLVRQEPRHDEESLFKALEIAFPESLYPELDQGHFEAAIKAALQG